MLAIILLTLGVLARFLPHVPNFTPVIAIALFGGVYLKGRQAVFLPVLLMIATDLVLGLHPVIAFTWGSVLVISVLGTWLKQKLSVTGTLIASLASAVIFFVVTNFGVWLAYYPQTWEGFVSCYTLAIPFFRVMLVSTLVYAIALFGGYEFVASKVRKTRLEPVLLK